MQVQTDVFRLILKNEFLSDSDYVTLLISNSEYVKGVYQKASKQDKDGFRNIINDGRDDNDLIEKLGKALDIRKSKESFGGE